MTATGGTSGTGRATDATAPGAAAPPSSPTGLTEPADPLGAAGAPGRTAWEKVGSALWAGIPFAAAVGFICASLKVFRAAHMETSTTVSILSSADTVALLKDVLVTLLPGFFAGLLAAAIWLWVRSIPPTAPRRALTGPAAFAVLVLMVIGYFTISLVVYALFVLSVLICLATLFGTDQDARGGWRRTWRKILVAVSFTAAVGSVLFIALATNVWLPLQDIELRGGHTITVGDVVIKQHVAAYVLESDDKTTTLLLDEPRAVVRVPTSAFQPNPPICIPARSGSFSLLQRPSQWLGPDQQFISPYSLCPVSA